MGGPRCPCSPAWPWAPRGTEPTRHHRRDWRGAMACTSGLWVCCPLIAAGRVSPIFFLPMGGQLGRPARRQFPRAAASSRARCRQTRCMPSAPSSLFAEHGYLLFAAFRNEMARCRNNQRETFLSSSPAPSALRPPECELVS